MSGAADSRAPQPPDWLTRALDYPYDVRREPLMFRPAGVEPLPCGWRPEGRLPVIAVGSNRAPAQLARKFQGWPAETEIPVTVADMADHDVVYSGHFARYGAVPARLASAAGVRVEVGITWLTADQALRMHATEGGENYRFVLTADVAVTDRTVGRLDRVGLYAGRHPPISWDGKPLALAAIAADGRRGEAMDQQTLQARVRDRLSPDADLAAFVRQTVDCPVTRSQRSHRLRAIADLAPVAGSHGSATERG